MSPTAIPETVIVAGVGRAEPNAGAVVGFARFVMAAFVASTLYVVPLLVSVIVIVFPLTAVTNPAAIGGVP